MPTIIHLLQAKGSTTVIMDREGKGCLCFLPLVLFVLDITVLVWVNGRDKVHMVFQHME